MANDEQRSSRSREGLCSDLEIVASNLGEMGELDAEEIVREAVRRLLSETTPTVRVSRSLAERTEAMFRSVDPEGHIAQEWKHALLGERERAPK